MQFIKIYILSLSILCRNRTQSSQRSLFIASRTHAHINIQIHTVFFPSNNTKCIRCKPKGKEGPTQIFFDYIPSSAASLLSSGTNRLKIDEFTPFNPRRPLVKLCIMLRAYFQEEVCYVV